MLKVIFDWFFGGKPKDVAPAPKVLPESAPYKVEPPVVTPIAVPPESGKSVETTSWPFPTPVGTAEETPVKPAVKAKSARTKKAPAAAMTAAKPKKAPAKPRAKKTQK